MYGSLDSDTEGQCVLTNQQALAAADRPVRQNEMRESPRTEDPSSVPGFGESCRASTV